jgi:hypothetical protein
LQKHDRHKGDHHQKVNDDKNGLHLLTLRIPGAAGAEPLSWAARSMAQGARPRLRRFDAAPPRLCSALSAQTRRALEVSGRYADEVVGLEARAADQRAIDIGQA